MTAMREWPTQTPAIVDTHPQGGDNLLAPFMSGAGRAQTRHRPNSSNTPTQPNPKGQ